MINFVCLDTGNLGSIVLWVVLIAVLVVMLIVPTFTQKKRNKEFMEMLDSIKVGDTVRTAGGVIGRVTKIMDKGEIRTVILETGSKAEKSYMEFDLQMIGAVLKSSKAVEEDTDKTEETVTTPVEESKTETASTEAEAPAKTTAAKKSTARVSASTSKKTSTKTSAKSKK